MRQLLVLDGEAIAVDLEEARDEFTDTKRTTRASRTQRRRSSSGRNQTAAARGEDCWSSGGGQIERTGGLEHVCESQI